MAKYYGAVGYVETKETSLGVWEEIITERKYYGDIIKNTRRLENGQHLNDNISLNNQISIVSDPYAIHNIFAIRYVDWLGAKWKVTNVEVQHPRLILTIGGVYNGPTGWATQGPV
jgi:hypothetical protein